MNKDQVKYIVIHCSATRSNTSYPGWQLDLDHRARGFSQAGYHFYVRRSGEIERLRSLTRPGAHVRGYNRCSIGVCYEGGLDEAAHIADTRTEEQRRSLERLLKGLCRAYPLAVIVGHRDLSPDLNGDGLIEPSEWVKACPSFDARQAYSHLCAGRRLG